MALFKINIKPHALFFIMLIAGLNGGSQQLDNQDSASIYLGWYHQFQFAGYYAAQELGFYEEEGVKVKLIEFDGDFGVKRVLANDYDYAIGTAGQVLGSTSRDSLVIVASIFQQSPLALMVEEGSGIESLRDLEGKKVGVGNELKAMMHVAGVNIDKVEFHDPTSFTSYLDSGTLDGIAHYVIDSINTDNYRLFRPIEYGIHFYGECLYATLDQIEKNREQVEGIRKATLKGWEFAVANPGRVIDMIIDKYNPSLPREVLEREAERVLGSQVLASFYPIGYNDMDRWIHMDRTLSQFITYENPVDWNKFIYQPEDAVQNQTIQRLIRYGWIGGVSALIIFLGLFIYNRQLKNAVKNRTHTIQQAKSEIEEINQKLLSQKEELESLNTFKDKMLSIISHDVRGPLHTVQGLIELMTGGSISKDQFGDVIKHSRNKIQDISYFLDNILYWARNQDQGIQLNPQTTDLKKIVEKTVSMLSVAAESKSIVVDDEIPADTSVYVDADTTQLIVRNLISNAIKFCDSGDKITLGASTMDNQVRVYVKDTGPGIALEVQEKIFKSELITTHGSKEELGTGLGLQLCREFAKKNGGEMGLNSEPGSGSEFWFTIPKSNEST